MFNNLDLARFVAVPSTDLSSIALGQNNFNALTTGANNLGFGPSATAGLTTGSNNIIIATGNASGFPSTTTSNNFWLGAGATAIMSATSINGTPAVTIPGSLTVQGALTASGGITLTNMVGTVVGGVATGTYSQTNSTLANVTGMVANVVPGTYLLEAYLATTNNGTGGIKLSLGGGTAVASTVLIDTFVNNTTTATAEANSTTLAGPQVSAAVAATVVIMNGTVIVSTGGTIQLQAAQNTTNGTALTIANGSYLQLTRIA